MPKFKAEIIGAPCILENIYRASISSAVKSARKTLDNTSVVHTYARSNTNIIIKVYEGTVVDAPYFSKKKRTQYTLVHEESYELPKN